MLYPEIMEFLTAAVLAFSAGINAYIPMLTLGLLARFSSFVTLPQSWEWISSTPMLIILGVLLLIELLVDKFPVLDSVNDVLQTLVRPASGGVVFTAGLSSETLAVETPNDGSTIQTWIPVVAGIVIALVPHILNAVIRPALNSVTGGLAAPVMSFIKDVFAVITSLLAVIVPVLGLLIVLLLTFFVYRKIKKARLSRKSRAEKV